MVKQDVIDLLNSIDTRRPKMFSDDTDFAQVVDEWYRRLGKYSKKELDILLSSFYLQYLNPDAVLEDIIIALEQQRYERTPQGIAEKDTMIVEWNKRHPHKEVKTEEDNSYAAYYWGILIDDEWHLVDDSTLPFPKERPRR